LKRSNRLVLLVGVFLAVVAFVGIAVILSGGNSNGSPTASVVTTLPTVIAAQDIPLGVRIRPEMLTTAPKKVGSERNAGAFADPSRIIGLVVRRAISTGAQLDVSDFNDTGFVTQLEVPAGKLAYQQTSLAAALALPYRTAFGTPFPARPTIVFITFVVIFVTLVGQGLSLIPLLRWLHLGDRGDDGERREIEIRVKALEGGLRKISELEHEYTGETEREVLRRLRLEYEDRIDHLRRHMSRRAVETPEAVLDHKAQLEVLHAERRTINRLRDRGQIPEDLFRKVQYDMDLAEARMF